MSQSSGDPVMYGLYAVLVHSGYSCHAGHYYCYVKVRWPLRSYVFILEYLLEINRHFLCLFISFHCRQVMDNGTKWMIQWCTRVTSKWFWTSRLMSFSIWGKTLIIKKKTLLSVSLHKLISLIVSWRIPETRKNADGQTTKQGMLHSGKNSASSEQIKRASLNGPLSSPQVTKVKEEMMFDLIHFFDCSSSWAPFDF